MARHLLRSALLLLLVVISIISACAAPNPPSKPSVVITSPPSNSQFHEGDDVTIQSVSNDADGIAKVELIVDGQVARADVPPSPQATLSLIQTWRATAGSHSVVVRAYNKAGLSSDPAAVQVSILAANAPLAAPTLAAATLPPALPPPPAGNSGPPPGGQGSQPSPSKTQPPQPSATPSATANSGGSPIATFVFPPVTLIILPTATPTFKKVITLPPITLIIKSTNTPAPVITKFPLPTKIFPPFKP